MSKKKHQFMEYNEIHEDYTTRYMELPLRIPANFRMLCALFETPPEQVLTDFMWNVSYMVTEASDEQRQAAAEYFMRCGYGRDIYPEEDIRRIFHELEAKRCLWPDVDDKVMRSEQRELHYTWSHMYMLYWFEKWYKLHRRKVEKEPMKGY